jgi:hypothetical protein
LGYLQEQLSINPESDSTKISPYPELSLKVLLERVTEDQAILFLNLATYKVEFQKYEAFIPGELELG